MGTDARVMRESGGRPDGPRCKVCGTPIRGDGPGQRPAYCGRACSSKAYRARTRDKQAAALAATTLDGSREPLSSGAAQQIADLGAVVERLARGLAQTLDQGVRPGVAPVTGRMVLGLPLSGLERAVQELLSRARAATHQALAAYEREVDGSREASDSVARESVQGEGRVPAEAVAPAVGPAPEAAPPRPRDASRDASREDLDASRGASRPDLNAPRVASRPDLNVPRVASPAGEESSRVASPATESLVLLPIDQRDLGPTTYASALTEAGPGWEIRGWDDQEHLCLVAHRGRIVGWTEYGVGGEAGWVAVVGLGSPPPYLVDVQDRPIRRAGARLAARDIALALTRMPAPDPA
ncbi:hypothetical protein ACFVT9_28990 [Kitasatospora cineracea]|uniref:hypothetical protein n=1 Tax=Kitasatospora cineracea TaxID=88074 RepID=UPI0036D7D0CF